MHTTPEISSSYLKMVVVVMIADLTINGYPDGCTTLNDCSMIQDY